MKRILMNLGVAAIAFALFSCEEDRVVYDGGDFVTFNDVDESILSVFENAGTLEVPISISVPRAEDVTVTLSLTNGTAVSGVDFSTTSTTVVIPANATSANFTINVVDNADFGEVKNFTLSIVSTSAPDVLIGLSGDEGSFSKTVNIVNDDCPSKYTIWVGALNIEDVGYPTTPGTGAVTPAGTCDILRVFNPGNGLAGFPNFPGAGAPGYFDFVFTPDFEGATTGTVTVASTPLAPNGANFGTYEGSGTYDEDTATITIDYSVKAHSTSYTGPLLGTYYTGTNIITPAP